MSALLAAVYIAYSYLMQKINVPYRDAYSSMYKGHRLHGHSCNVFLNIDDHNDSNSPVTHLVWPRRLENPPLGGLGLGRSVHEEAHPCFPQST